MLNPTTGRDDVKFYATTLIMAERMAPGEERSYFIGLALEKLTSAVADEARRRSRCRDREVAAAVRVRSW